MSDKLEPPESGSGQDGAPLSPQSPARQRIEQIIETVQEKEIDADTDRYVGQISL